MPCVNAQNMPPMLSVTTGTAVDVGQPKLFYSLSALLIAYRQCFSVSAWKYSSQCFESTKFLRLQQLSEALQNRTLEISPYKYFYTSERGVLRRIQASVIQDRIFFRSLNDNVVLPAISKYLIYDNYASIKNRGLSRARKRMLTMLHKFYRATGSNDGYILQIDFRHYFDSIPHDKAIKLLCAYVKEKLAQYYLDASVNSYNGDCGVGLGSPIAQSVGIMYPMAMDNYLKIRCRVKYYGRYMDDLFIIHKNRAYLLAVLKVVTKFAEALGLIINMRKTKITKLSHGFVYLKTHYRLSLTGKVFYTPCSETFRRERRKLKGMYRLYKRHSLRLFDIINSYKSWRGNLAKFYKSAVAHRLFIVDRFFYRLYGVNPV